MRSKKKTENSIEVNDLDDMITRQIAEVSPDKPVYNKPNKKA